MGQIVAEPTGLDMDIIDLTALRQAAVVARSASFVRYDLGNGELFTVSGSDFTYDNSGALADGEITGISATSHGQSLFSVTDLSVAPQDFANWVANDTPVQANVQLFSGDDTMVGAANASNVLDGYGSYNSIVGGSYADTLIGEFGGDTIFGNAGNDRIDVASTDTTNYLRGGEGDDTIICGEAVSTSNVNGNQGNDSIVASGENDWLLGGQGDDVIQGGVDSIINGNLGNDTLSAGAGHNTLRGGQGDDSIHGGFMDDQIFGDLGNDTLVGGQGADTFHFGPGSGHDRILDFNAGEGDRVQLDGVTSYTVIAAGNATSSG